MCLVCWAKPMRALAASETTWEELSSLTMLTMLRGAPSTFMTASHPGLLSQRLAMAEETRGCCYASTSRRGEKPYKSVSVQKFTHSCMGGMWESHLARRVLEDECAELDPGVAVLGAEALQERGRRAFTRRHFDAPQDP